MLSYVFVIYKYYKCGNKKYGKAQCEKRQVNKKWLEDLVAETTKTYILTDEMFEKIAKQLVSYNNKLNENNQIELYEKELKDIEKNRDNIMKAVEQGFFNEKSQERMLELESRKADLIHLIDEEKLNIPIPLTEDEIIFWLEQFKQGEEDDEKFKERLIDTFVNKVILYNDKMVIIYNVKGKDNEKLSIDEKFEYEQFGADGRT